MAGARDGIPAFPRLSRTSSGMARLFAGGASSSQAGPAGGGVTDQSGPVARNRVRLGGASRPTAASSATQSTAASSATQPTAASSATQPTAASSATQPQVGNSRELDRFMPLANVIRIMRKVLPMHAKISDDGKETIQQCVSEFINFITGEANERCHREHRKTVTADDIIWAMGKLGFEDYVVPLGRYLQRYRELEVEQRNCLLGEHFPIVKQRHHPQIRDTVLSPPVNAPPPISLRSPLPPPQPPSSLVMPPTVPPPHVNHPFGEDPGAGYYSGGMYWGGDGSGASNSGAPPMPDFFP